MYVVLVLDPTSFSFVEHCAMNLSLFPRFFLSHTFSFTFSLFHSSIFIAATSLTPGKIISLSHTCQRSSRAAAAFAASVTCMASAVSCAIVAVSRAAATLVAHAIRPPYSWPSLSVPSSCFHIHLT